MGYMTVVSILNDAWATIKENPKQFIQNIEDGMENYYGSAVNSYPVSNYSNPMEVRRSFHANQSKVLVVGGNHMEDLGEMKPVKSRDDFYLAYKMRTVHCAEDAVAAAKLEVIVSAADMFAAEMTRNGKDVSQIAETIQDSDIYGAMTEDEREMLLSKIKEKTTSKRVVFRRG